jgi:hypothetical protein
MNLLNDILYPCVRVKTKDAGGSGTVLCCRSAETKNQDELATYVLTCHHVIEGAIEVKEDWNPLLGRNAKREFRSTVTVEFFKYRHGGRTSRTESVDADILAWNKKQDLAVLRLRMEDRPPAVAKWFPKDLTFKISLFDRVLAVGAALGHPPIVTEGIITGMSDEIDDLSYWMSNAQIIFGNSGGAVFHANERGHEFIGVPSRVAVYGWTVACSHMGYFSDIERIYKWLDEECFQFLYDPSCTIKQCETNREAKRDKELELHKLRGVEPEDKKRIEAPCNDVQIDQENEDNVG